MRKITPSQMRKIYALAKENGMNKELLHIIVENETDKTSIAELNIMEAVKVIDKISDRKQSYNPKIEHMSYKQEAYIKGLAKDLGWVDVDGGIDEKRLNGFCKKYYGIETYKWLTRSLASKVIEGLKTLIMRNDETKQA